MTSGEARQILDGAILSDCGIHDRALAIDLSGTAHMDWLLHIRDALLTVGASINPKYPRTNSSCSRGKKYAYIQLATKACSIMEKYQGVWYHDGIKEVPEDFAFTPISLANGFMGDGSSRTDRTCVDVRLSTESYSEHSIVVLEDALHGLGILHTSRATNRRVKSGSGIAIMVLQDDVNRFMDTVEPYMLPSFMYKIKRRQEPALRSKFMLAVRRREGKVS